MGTPRKRRRRSPSLEEVEKPPRKGNKIWVKTAVKNLKQTDMACVPSDRQNFEDIMECRRQENEKRQSQEFELQVRIKASPRPRWIPSDNNPDPVKGGITKEVMASVPLADVYTTNSNEEWVPPPTEYPVDFDQNGNVRATRTPEDPAPLAWAYGLPIIYIARGGTPLLGRTHGTKLGNLSLKTDSNLKNIPVFTVGPIIASASFVNMPRTLERQYTKLTGEATYPMEKPPL
ncbi:hypothetical protein N7449_005268 [Penicillium cf. viridicatum]|uniref:Uncharacterized protein n=1 Tax=Penicillium cf. viridicatum TaxID=2972119 RepID=A0A9W9MKT8_9EURO|nr:hypothetical protein N7449_005268 [Penicillium cf. viridicatum]